jgi:hypothetical protein
MNGLSPSSPAPELSAAVLCDQSRERVGARLLWRMAWHLARLVQPYPGVQADNVLVAMQHTGVPFPVALRFACASVAALDGRS